MSFRNIFIVVCLMISTLLSGACSGLNRSDKPATTTWWLEPYTKSTLAEAGEPALMLDLSVVAVPGLDTHRILVLSDNGELEKYAGARWADSLPELLNSLVGRSLEASGRFTLVPGEGGVENCNLELEVRKFYSNRPANGQTRDIQVSMGGRYKCEGSVPEIFEVSAVVPVHDDRMTVIVEAFQAALNAVIVDLLSDL